MFDFFALKGINAAIPENVVEPSGFVPVTVYRLNYQDNKGKKEVLL